MKTKLSSTSALLCAVFITVAAALTLPASGKGTPTPKGANLITDAKKDLDKKLSDGRHVLPVQLGDDEKLVAVVKKGQPMSLIVEDKQGKQIATTQHTNPPTAQSKAVTCWICYTSSTGRTKCVEITCPGQPTI